LYKSHEIIPTLFGSLHILENPDDLRVLLPEVFGFLLNSARLHIVRLCRQLALRVEESQSQGRGNVCPIFG
jgi:hypothetical protein